MIIALAVLAATTAFQQEPRQFRTIIGEVRDTAGTPLGNVDVLALSAGRMARTAPNGVFQIDSVRLGEQRFLFRAIGYHRVEVEVIVRAEAEKMSVRLTPTAVTLDPVTVTARRTGVFGVIGDAGYNPLSAVEVDVIGGGHAMTDSTGRFNLPRVRGGTYMLRVKKRGYYPLTRSLTIPRDEAMELSLLLVPLPPGLSDRRIDALSGYGARLGWALAESDSRQMRCRGGSSVLVTREELAEQGRGSLADALPRVASVSAKGYGRTELLRYRVNLDGYDTPGPPGGGEPLDGYYVEDISGWPLAGIAVEDVEAVEIYKGYPTRSRISSGFSRRAPLSFGTLSRRTASSFGCPSGTIWIWMR